MKALLLTLILSLFASCASEMTSGPRPDAYQGVGIEQFFLPELPAWVNGSVGLQCKRSLTVRYLDYVALEKMHALTFLQSLELQTQFNRKFKERYAAAVVGLSPQEEAVLFMESLEQVKGGLRELKFPASPKTHLVLIDSFKSDPKVKERLVELAERGDPVVLVSFCDDALGLEAWVTSLELGEFGFYYLGAESMGPVTSAATYYGPVMPLKELFQRERTTLWHKGELSQEFTQGFISTKVED